MPLDPTQLAQQLANLSSEGKSQEEIALEFATVITNYIKTATVTSDGVGNMGAPVKSVGTIT